MIHKTYRPIEEYPEKIEVPIWWGNGGGMMFRRDSLSHNHPEHPYNWFCRTYPDLNPAVYGLKHPLTERYEEWTRDELIQEIARLNRVSNECF